jgi:hypothetical protein
VPEADDSCDRENSQDERKHAHGCLGQHQELALIEAVRSRSRPGQEQKLRSKLEAHHDTQRRRIVMGQLRQHEPILSNALHPRTDVGNQGARRPQAEVEASEGAKGAGHWVLHVRVGVLPP